MASVDINSDITGTIWKIEVKPGDSVAQDDILIIIESMKMEIPVLAPEAGKVVEILVAEEEAIKEGQLLARLES